jgi:bacillithiol system protein YtxJ
MPLPWSRSTQAAPGLPEVGSIDECNSLLQQELVILFKHSPTCPVSWVAHREVMRFRTDFPEVPLHLVSVRARRDISLFLAEKTGIVHESPQVLIFRKGQVIGDASHDEVTADFIARTAGLNS